MNTEKNITSTIDLHTHTYFSDGRASPAELVAAAASRSLQVLAICDHDNAHGTRQALPLAEAAGLRLIPAVEFTSQWEACEMPPEESDIDLLGYFVDLDSPDFHEAEEAGMTDITMRIEAWCRALSESGYPVDLTDVLAQNIRYAGTLQLIQAVQAKGYAADFAGAEKIVRRWIKQVPPCNRSIAQAIDQIHASGGVAVLAHPGPRYIRWHGGLLDSEGIELLLEMGLDGLEVYHFTVDQATRQHFLELANRYDLVITGGSDDHGWPDGFPYLGSQPVSVEMVEKLEERARRYG